MGQTRIEAFKKEFPEIVFYESHIFEDADSIKIKRLDAAKLREKVSSKNPRDNNFDGPAGDSYSETTLFLIYVRDGDFLRSCVAEGESILDHMIKSKIEDVSYCVEMLREGGYDCQNQNEFGYGNEKHIIIYKKSKFDIKNFISNELENARLEVKREANF